MSLAPFLAAVAQFPVWQPARWAEVEQRIEQWVYEAATRGAKLLVFPEYASMSLAALFAPQVQLDLHAQVRALQTLREDYLALYRRLAEAHAVYLLAGSFPWQLSTDRIVNRAWLCGPAGECGFQDKQIMTRFEREQWGIAGGEPLKVFDTGLGCIGVTICYDSEFPLLVRTQVEAGAELLLVPSCTDALSGYHRVRVAAQARALESQCPVLLSALVGEAAWSPAVDINVGAAACYGPPDLGFPHDGVLAQGVLNEPAWVYAQIDPALTARVRAQGQVLNVRHWPEQIGRALPSRQTV